MNRTEIASTTVAAFIQRILSSKLVNGIRERINLIYIKKTIDNLIKVSLTKVMLMKKIATTNQKALEDEIFLVKIPVPRALKLNPIIDEGTPTSTGSINSAMNPCWVLGTLFRLEHPHRVYKGTGMRRPNITANYYLLILGFTRHQQQAIWIYFDLTNEESLFIIGLDSEQYFTRTYLRYIPFIAFLFLEITAAITLPIYKI